MTLTLTLVQMRGYSDDGADPIHVFATDAPDDRWGTSIRDNSLEAPAQGAISQILSAARVAREIPPGAPIIAQIDPPTRTITAGLPGGNMHPLDLDELPSTIPGTISIVLNEFARVSQAALPEPPA